MDKIRLGINACLLGQSVRYDGGHKLDRYLTDTLGQHVEYVPVCPEAECGLGVPREPMRLVGGAESPRLVTVRTNQDLTARMMTWAGKRVKELEREHLCGFIFKSGSPSCGTVRVKIYNDRGMAEKKGIGIFAGVFMDHFPLFPVEEEGRLHDPKLRENFIESIFALMRWRELVRGEKSLGALVTFHAQHKLLILSHSEKHYRALGKLVADAKNFPLKEIYARYEMLLMEALKLLATIKKNVNVLQHMMGYFKEQLSKDEKQELLEVLEGYRNGFLPLIVPVTLINHYVRKYKEAYLSRQVYLNPPPIALQLRNHA